MPSLRCRAVAGVLALALAAVPVQLGAASASAAEHAGPTWASAPPAPIAGRTNAAAVGLSDESVLIFGGRAAAGGLVAMQPVGGTIGPTRDAAVLNLRTETWTPVAPIPADIAVTRSSVGSPGYQDPVGSDGYAYSLAAPSGANGQPERFARQIVLRYDGAANRWDTFPLPSSLASQLVAASGRLVTLDLSLERAAAAPGGAVLDTDGTWHMLPTLPSDKHGNKHTPWSAAVWVHDRLMLTSDLLDGRIYVAALNLDDLKAGWTARPAVISPYPRPNVLPPAAVAGRIVWPMVTYDPATGRSAATPAAIRDKLKRQSGGDASVDLPSMLPLGEQVTLAGYAYDPVTGTTTDIPPVPQPTIGGAAAWTGGPYGLLGFGGRKAAAGPITTTTNAAVRLLPARGSELPA